MEDRESSLKGHVLLDLKAFAISCVSTVRGIMKQSEYVATKVKFSVQMNG